MNFVLCCTNKLDTLKTPTAATPNELQDTAPYGREPCTQCLCVWSPTPLVTYPLLLHSGSRICLPWGLDKYGRKHLAGNMVVIKYKIYLMWYYIVPVNSAVQVRGNWSCWHNKIVSWSSRYTIFLKIVQVLFLDVCLRVYWMLLTCTLFIISTLF